MTMKLSIAALDQVVFAQKLMSFDPDSSLFGRQGYLVAVDSEKGVAQAMIDQRLVVARIEDFEPVSVRS